MFKSASAYMLAACLVLLALSNNVGAASVTRRQTRLLKRSPWTWDTGSSNNNNNNNNNNDSGGNNNQAMTTSTSTKKTSTSTSPAAAATSADPWTNFSSFNWNTWTTWGWSDHTLAYVKAWYYDTYGYNLPQGVASWGQLSYYVSELGTSSPKPTPTLSVYTDGGENPWESATTTSTSTSSTKMASSTSTSTSTSSSKPASTTSSSTSASPTFSIVSSTSSSSAKSTSTINVSSVVASVTTVASTITSTSIAASATAAVKVPSGWSISPTPCIAEGTTGRALLGSFTINYSNTIESCLASCDAGGFPLAGLQYGNQCFCGSYLSNGASLTKTATCNVACAGDSSATCGGYYAYSLFITTGIGATTLSDDLTENTITLPSGWSAETIPCISDVSGRALAGASMAADTMTTATCLNYCAGQGYQYAGLEYGRECYCDNSLQNGALLTTVSSSCGTPCAGAPTESCGGWNALQIFNNPAYSFSNTIINGYVKTACIQEVTDRALRGAAYTDSSMTIESCTAYCSDRGYVMAGLEYGDQCYCGSSLVGGASLLLTSGQCYMDCAGDSSENCGGPNAIWLYVNPSTTLAATITIPSGWSKLGCVAEGSSGRALTYDATSVVGKTQMTGEACSQTCNQLGYDIAGTEYSSQCYCGSALSNGATGAIIDTLTNSTSQCNYPCSGNWAQMCGGSNRLTLYSSLTLSTIKSALSS